MFRKIIKLFIPQLIIKLINYFLKRNIKIEKSFANWSEAILSSGKYSNNKIFHKSKNSFLKVIRGKAVYERDSVLFFNKNLNLPLISLMERIRKKKKNKLLKVLDFGGSFGSTYFQNREYFSDSTKYIWDIIEQKKIVNFAKKKIKMRNLFFYESLTGYIKKNKPDIVLFSSVLHYLESPFSVLSLLKKSNISYFIILKTPFFNNKSEIKMQVNPSYIYKANYPIRIFNEHLFKSFFIKWNYKIDKLNWENQIIDDINFKSFFIKRIIN
jgi:putative methyltransferase (TIGR04325 family)